MLILCDITDCVSKWKDLIDTETSLCGIDHDTSIMLYNTCDHYFDEFIAALEFVGDSTIDRIQIRALIDDHLEKYLIKPIQNMVGSNKLLLSVETRGPVVLGIFTSIH